MPKKLTPREFAELARSMPGASEGQIIEAALMKEWGDDPRLPAGLPPPHIPGVGLKGPGPIPDPNSLVAPPTGLTPYDPSGAEFGWDLAAKATGLNKVGEGIQKAIDWSLERTYQPELRSNTYTPQQDAYSLSKVGALPLPKTAEALDPRDYPKAAASFVSAPADIAGLASMGMGSLAGRLGLWGISRGARLMEAASSLPVVGSGLSMMADRDASFPEKLVGAGMAALGSVGGASAMTHAYPVGKVRDAYLKEAGRSTARAKVPGEWDKDLAVRTADAFQAMAHAPDDPVVRANYQALADEVEKQYEFVTQRAGLRAEPAVVDPSKGGTNYANSAEMARDVRQNNRLTYYPTEVGFGPDATKYADNPLYAVSPRTGLRYNDMLRVVHDYFGHADNGWMFGPLGEFRAYLEHRSMMPNQAAIDALATETHGQNSWVNAGPHLRNTEGRLPAPGEPGYIHPSQRPFAEQKAGVLPRHIIDMPEYRFLDAGELTGPNTPLADGTPYGIVSAGNPGTKLSDAENAARHAALKQDLRSEFYRPMDQTGMFDNPEPSVLVPGLTPEATQRLGKKYGQVSSISDQGYHRHADNATFERTGPVVFDPNAENYYSELHEVVLPDGRRVKYQMQFPDEAYGPPPGSESGFIAQPLAGQLALGAGGALAGAAGAAAADENPFLGALAGGLGGFGLGKWAAKGGLTRTKAEVLADLIEVSKPGRAGMAMGLPDLFEEARVLFPDMPTPRRAAGVSPGAGRSYHKMSGSGPDVPLEAWTPEFRAWLGQQAGDSQQGVERLIQAQADAPAGTLAPSSGPSIELLDDADGLGLNASGESAASLEAQSRLAGMKQAGEQFVLQGPGGVIRPIANTVDAVDVQAPKGWTKGILGKDGKFRALAVVAPAAAPFVDTGDPELDAAIRAALVGTGAAGLGAAALKGNLHPLLQKFSPEKLRRMQDQGYDTSQVWFHGTNEPNIRQFRQSSDGEFGPGVYFSSSPTDAAGYASGLSGPLPDATVYPVVVRGDMPRATWTDNPDLVGQEEALARKNGGVVTSPGGHTGGLDEEVSHAVVTKPSRIRSIFAEFDPAKLSSGNILAASAGPTAALAMPSTGDEELDAKIRLGLVGSSALGLGMAAGWYPKGLERRLDRFGAKMRAKMRAEGGVKDSLVKTAQKELIRSLGRSPAYTERLEDGYFTIPLPTHNGINYDARVPAEKLLAKDRANGGVKLTAESAKRTNNAYEVGHEAAQTWGDARWLYHLTNGDPDAAVQFTRLLGAFSPQQATSKNLMNAVEAFMRSLRGEAPDAILDTMMYGHPLPETVRDNFKRAVELGRIFRSKTEALAGAELGVHDGIPIDQWLLRAIGAQSDKTPGKQAYRLLSEAIAKEAAKRGESPFSYMAKVWMGMQRIVGTPTPSFSEAVSMIKLPGPVTSRATVDQALGNFQSHIDALNEGVPTFHPIATSPKMPFEEWLPAAQARFREGQAKGDVLGKIPTVQDQPASLDKLREVAARRLAKKKAAR